MKMNTEVLKTWIENITVQLPGFNELAKSAATDTLIIGTGVFEIYQELEWIQPFKRKTGDRIHSLGLGQCTAGTPQPQFH
jgi:hypothetical protein